MSKAPQKSTRRKSLVPNAAKIASARAMLIEQGRLLRKRVPRVSHALWKPSMRRHDPLEMLISSGRSRLPELLPLRYGRMSQSPFSYMRGAAAIMASDVAGGPMTGIRMQACGDCHLGNFGAFASPERRVLFDINDFDETLPASWEFDLKRLAVSFVLLARQQGHDGSSSRAVARAMLGAYRKHLHIYSGMAPLEVWYAIIDSEVLIRTAPDEATRMRRIEFEMKARRRTADKLIGKLLEQKGGQLGFKAQPPTIVRLKSNSRLDRSFRKVLERYPDTLPEDRRHLLSRYRLVDVALKVVGVGSVGTRCGVALYVSDGGERLVLQVKEASASVLEPFAGKGPHKHQGQRVVAGQRLMQCASDIFLGWASDDDGHQYYVRQLRDMKTSVPYESLKGDVLHNFADMCGWALARAHAKSGDSARLAGYIGTTDKFDRAIAAFSSAYADQCERDFDTFSRAIKSGRLPVESETA